MGATRAYRPDDAFGLGWLQSAALHPDGSLAAYALSRHDAETDADITNLWLVDLVSGDERQLTSEAGTDSSPAWSPDGALAFVSDRAGGTAQLFLLDRFSGAATQLTALPNGVDGPPVWSPEGTRLAFTARRQDAEPEDPTQPYRVTRNVYRFDGLGYVHRVVNDVYVMTVETGDVERLTANDAVNGGLVWSPDGTKLLFKRSLDADTFLSVRPNIACVDLGGDETTVVSNDDFAVRAATWHVDSARIVFAATPRSRPNGCKADLYVFDPATGALSNRTTALPMGVCGILQADMPSGLDLAASQIRVTADGSRAWCEVQRGGASEIVSIALAGPESVEIVVDGNRCARFVDVAADESTLLFSSSDINRPIDLFARQAGTGADGAERRVTAVNADLLAELDHASVRHLRFTSIDGAEVEAWHVAPADRNPHTADGAWPTLLSIHGGPHLGFGNTYRFDTQMLLGAGFAVLMVNQRASSGYDDDFGTITGDWGNLDFHDLMYGVDHAIDQGFADPDRLGVFGLSGGGYLSCWMVGQTDRFKAAVPENPITNWTSSYGVGDASVWLAVEELGGHPHEIPDVYARCSPISHAHNCTTPTLLIQGEADWRCTAEQSEQFYTVLKVNGCEVEMLRLPGSSHMGAMAGAPAVRRAKNDAMLEWLTRHVLSPGAGD